MTFFAEIKNGKVIRVIVATQEVINQNYSGTLVETFMETDFTKNPKKNYASIGYDYDIDGDFIPPKPATSNTEHEVFLNPNSKRYIIRDKITKNEIKPEFK